MSTIARAFTTRKVKMSIEIAQEARSRGDVQRSNTTKAPSTKTGPARPAPIKHVLVNSNPGFRPKISAPLELVHTTNMLSYNAPDIYPRPGTSATSSTTSTKSDDDTGSGNSSPTTAASSPPTSPDVAPRDRSISSQSDHLPSYFKPPVPALSPPTPGLPPAIPQRAPSHTKKASFEAMSRQRSNSRSSNLSGTSVSTKASGTFSRSSSTSTTASTISHSSMASPIPKMPPTPVMPALSPRMAYESKKEEPHQHHPFGQELAQVTEIAEEYGVKERLQVIDEEEQDLMARGLFKFNADVYLREIQNLASSFFLESTNTRPMATMWI